VLEADFLVSMPKIKTHHWSGVTLAMKNMFGIVPGARYGWPKNILHWKGIQESILDLCATVPIHFVIADGIVAMEGDGPLNGTPRPMGRIVLADDPVAADATCARLMGFEPSRIVHIREGARFLGNADPEQVDQVGETVGLSCHTVWSGSRICEAPLRSDAVKVRKEPTSYWLSITESHFVPQQLGFFAPTLFSDALPEWKSTCLSTGRQIGAIGGHRGEARVPWSHHSRQQSEELVEGLESANRGNAGPSSSNYGNRLMPARAQWSTRSRNSIRV